jgi:hypothetical protein
MAKVLKLFILSGSLFTPTILAEVTNYGGLTGNFSTQSSFILAGHYMYLPFKIYSLVLACIKAIFHIRLFSF